MESDEARKAFEKEREKILKDLPDSIKKMFGAIAFGPSAFDEDEIVPVLIMNPYHVPPKPVRDVYWFDLYSKTKRSKKLPHLAYLVYHYGADDPDDCYTFIEHKDLISYEDGVAQGYDRLSAEIQTKINDAATSGTCPDLTPEEQMKVRGLEELQEDLAKPPHERRRGVDFLERWQVLEEEELKEFGDDDDEDEDDDDDGNRNESSEQPNLKKQKIK